MSQRKKRRGSEEGGSEEKKRKKFSLPSRTETDPDFHEILQRSYSGLFICGRKEIEERLHKDLLESLELFHRLGLFEPTPITVKGKVIRTTVRRLALGSPGITYPYFDAKLFPFPITQVVEEGMEEIPRQIALAMKPFQALRSWMQVKEKEGCKINLGKESSEGEFNLVLVNQFDPNSVDKANWVEDNYHNLGQMATLWHKDPFLKPNSSVGVYQVDTETNGKPGNWRVGFRVPFDEKTPAISLSLESGSVYMMLGDFNETRFHGVFAGETLRYSIVHRKMGDHHDLHFLKERVSELEKRIAETGSSLENFVESQAMTNEVEFHWIRPFWFHGAYHAKTHHFWLREILVLEDFWKRLEYFNRAFIENVKSSPCRSVIDVVLPRLEFRQKAQVEWLERSKAELFLQMEDGFRPILKPIYDEELSTFSLPKAIQSLQESLQQL